MAHQPLPVEEINARVQNEDVQEFFNNQAKQ